MQTSNGNSRNFLKRYSETQRCLKVSLDRFKLIHLRMARDVKTDLPTDFKTTDTGEPASGVSRSNFESLYPPVN